MDRNRIQRLIEETLRSIRLEQPYRQISRRIQLPHPFQKPQGSMTNRRGPRALKLTRSAVVGDFPFVVFKMAALLDVAWDLSIRLPVADSIGEFLWKDVVFGDGHVANMLLACCEHVANMLRACCEHVANMLRTVCERVANMLRTLCEHVANILRTYCDLFANILRTYCELVANVLRNIYNTHARHEG